jgi:type IV secretory pathway TrbD component
VVARLREKGERMYIGAGTLAVILIVVLLVWLL